MLPSQQCRMLVGIVAVSKTMRVLAVQGKGSVWSMTSCMPSTLRTSSEFRSWKEWFVIFRLSSISRLLKKVDGEEREVAVRAKTVLSGSGLPSSALLDEFTIFFRPFYSFPIIRNCLSHTDSNVWSAAAASVTFQCKSILYLWNETGNSCGLVLISPSTPMLVLYAFHNWEERLFLMLGTMIVENASTENIFPGPNNFQLKTLFIRDGRFVLVQYNRPTRINDGGCQPLPWLDTDQFKYVQVWTNTDNCVAKLQVCSHIDITSYEKIWRPILLWVWHTANLRLSWSDGVVSIQLRGQCHIVAVELSGWLHCARYRGLWLIETGFALRRDDSINATKTVISNHHINFIWWLLKSIFSVFWEMYRIFRDSIRSRCAKYRERECEFEVAETLFFAEERWTPFLIDECSVLMSCNAINVMPWTCLDYCQLESKRETCADDCMLSEEESKISF